jgi:hypothetical protein
MRRSSQAIASTVAGAVRPVRSTPGPVRLLLLFALAACLLAPASAIAAAPVVKGVVNWPFSATEDGITSDINPGGLSTEYKVEYGLAASTWCTSSTSTGSPEASTTPGTLSGASTPEEEPRTVAVNLTGLTAGASYCAQLTAHNSSGTSHSGMLTFTAGASRIEGSGTDAGVTSARIYGSIDPPGGGPAEYYVSYGLASSSWCSTRGAQGSPEHQTPTQHFVTISSPEIGVEVTGLSPATSYCEELVASDAWGSEHTTQGTFTTLSASGSSPGNPPPTGGSTITTPEPPAPLVADLAISPSAFKAAARNGRMRITYWLSRATAVRFTILRVETGRTSSTGRCVARAKRAKGRAHPCTVTVAVPGGRSSRAGTGGRNTLHITDRLEGHALTPGRYVLRASVGAGSAPASARFQVLA